MWPFPKTPKRDTPPKPAWLKWLIVAFIVYVLAMANAPHDTKTRKVIEQAKQNITQNPTLQFESYKNKIFPEYGTGLRMNDVEQGAGASAVCGQQVSVSYQSFLLQGNELPDSALREKPLRFTVGDGHVMPVFDRGVIGMKVGGKRSIIAPPLMSYGLEDYKRDDVPKGANVRFEMELLSLNPELPSATESPYRIAEVAVGNGAMLVCGDQAQVHLTIWDITGKKLYETDKPVAVKLGASETMIGLEQGMIGMLVGGTRLLIIPPEFQRTMHGNAPKLSFPLPKGQVVMVEIRAQ